MIQVSTNNLKSIVQKAAGEKQKTFEILKARRRTVF